MKKLSLYAFSLSVFFAGMLAVWSLLMPATPEDETLIRRISDSADQSYFTKTMEDHRQQIDRKVSGILTDIYNTRQAFLFNIAEAIRVNGGSSAEVKQLLDLKASSDAAHLKTVSHILDRYGWLGADRIGALNTHTLFSVVQDSDFETQDKYTGMLENAVKQGTLSAEVFAQFVDRRAMARHQQQIYGTLLQGDLNSGPTALAPIADAEHVNERRLALGLNTIEAYAAAHHIELQTKNASR